MTTISFRHGVEGRRPVLAGTRLDVWQVIETVRQNGESAEAAAEYLGLPAEKVSACLCYYADHQDEIDGWAGRARDFAAQEEARWRREREGLA